MQKDI